MRRFALRSASANRPGVSDGISVVRAAIVHTGPYWVPMKPPSVAQVTFDCPANPDSRVLGHCSNGQSTTGRTSTSPRSVRGGRPPVLMFIRVPDKNPGKNVVHLDLRGDDLAAQVRRAVELGAEHVGDFDEYGVNWATCATRRATSSTSAATDHRHARLTTGLGCRRGELWWRAPPGWWEASRPAAVSADTGVEGVEEDSGGARALLAPCSRAATRAVRSVSSASGWSSMPTTETSSGREPAPVQATQHAEGEFVAVRIDGGGRVGASRCRPSGSHVRAAKATSRMSSSRNGTPISTSAST